MCAPGPCCRHVPSVSPVAGTAAAGRVEDARHVESRAPTDSDSVAALMEQLKALQLSLEHSQNEARAARAALAAAQPNGCCTAAKRAGVYTIADGEEVCEACFKLRPDARLVVHIDGAMRTAGATKPPPNAQADQARASLRTKTLELLAIIDEVQNERARKKPRAGPLNGVQCDRVQLAIPSHDEATADQADKMKKWFDKALAFGGHDVWDGTTGTPGLKVRARVLYDGIVTDAHNLLAASAGSMDELWRAMAGKSGKRGETRSGYAIRCLELIIARPGAKQQFVHEDAFTSEWLQWQVYVTDAGSATVGAVFSHTVFGEGDAAAVAYLRSLREKEVKTVSTPAGANRVAVTDREFEESLRKHASQVAMGMSGSAHETPIVAGAVLAGTVQAIARKYYHRAPVVGDDEEPRILLIGLGNKGGDDRDTPPMEAAQYQSPELAAALGLLDAMVESEHIMRQVREPWFLAIAQKRSSIFPRKLWEELLAVHDEHMAKDDRRRVAALTKARLLVRRQHDVTNGVAVALSDEEEEEEEEPGEFEQRAPLTRRWRELIPGIRARTTAAGTLGGRYRGHVHTWTPKAQEFDRTAQPTDAPWCHPFTGKATYLSSTFQGVISGFTNNARCKRELGLITGGTVWVIGTDASGSVVQVKLTQNTLLEIEHGARCNLVVTAKLSKEYVLLDHHGNKIDLIDTATNQLADVTDDALAPLLEFPVHLCDGAACSHTEKDTECWREAWAFDYHTTDSAALHVLCPQCFAAERHTRRDSATKLVFGKPATSESDSHTCGCPICWPLPSRLRRQTVPAP